MSGRSHPSRVRGLKHVLDDRARLLVKSHPSRVRGLKHHRNMMVPGVSSRTPRGCVD